MNIKAQLIALLMLCSIGTAIGQDYQLNGNLGVGTEPESKLDVDGDTKLRGDAEVEGDFKLKGMEGEQSNMWEKFLFVDEDGKLTKMDYDGWIAFINQMYALECSSGLGNPIWVNGTGSMLLCDEDDKLGIGTLNPAAQLHVGGSSIIGGNLRIGTTNNSSERLYVNGTGAFSGSSNNDLLSFRENGITTRFKIKGSGYLESNLNGSVDFWVAKSNNTERFRIKESGSMKLHLASDAPSAFEAIYDNEEIFRLDKDGSYSSKLSSEATRAISVRRPSDDAEVFRVDANGNIYGTKVTVEMAPFPDYVFEADYELMSLSDLKQYIKDNEHLPNMPSSKTVEDNGADLGELNRLLVEKVEELTLYVLDLQEQVNNLKASSVQDTK